LGRDRKKERKRENGFVQSRSFPELDRDRERDLDLDLDLDGDRLADFDLKKDTRILSKNNKQPLS
jgi:hypothetical protein